MSLFVFIVADKYTLPTMANITDVSRETLATLRRNLQSLTNYKPWLLTSALLRAYSMASGLVQIPRRFHRINLRRTVWQVNLN